MTLLDDLRNAQRLVDAAGKAVRVLEDRDEWGDPDGAGTPIILIGMGTELGTHCDTLSALVVAAKRGVGDGKATDDEESGPESSQTETQQALPVQEQPARKLRCLKSDGVRLIRSTDHDVPAEELAERLNVAVKTIRDVREGKTWNRLRQRRLTMAEAREIRTYGDDTFDAELAEAYDVHVRTISDCRAGRTWALSE